MNLPQSVVATAGTTAYSYEYMLRDHYPFGLQYPQNILVGTSVNRYLYNGKELQDGMGQSTLQQKNKYGWQAEYQLGLLSVDHLH